MPIDKKYPSAYGVYSREEQPNYPSPYGVYNREQPNSDDSNVVVAQGDMDVGESRDVVVAEVVQPEEEEEVEEVSTNQESVSILESDKGDKKRNL